MVHNDHKTTILMLGYVPFCIFICVFGIVGNALSLIVWKRLRYKSRVTNITTTLYFIVLAHVDIGVLLLSIAVMVLPVSNPELLRNYIYIFFISYIGHPLHFFMVFVSIYLITAMSVDRVRLVFRPFSRYSPKWKYTYVAIWTLSGIAAILNIPSFFEFQPQQLLDGSYVLQEVRYKNKRRFRNAVFVTHCIGVVVIPWITMFVSNVLLILRSSNRFRLMRKASLRRNEETSAEQRQLTHTLLLVSITTLVLLAVQCVARCVTMFHYIDSPIWNQIHFAREIGNLGIPLSSALNFILFFLPGKKFRKEFRVLMKTYCCGRPNTITPQTINTSSSINLRQVKVLPKVRVLHHNHINSELTSESPISSVLSK